MKLVFDYMGPTKESRAWSFDFLPHFSVHVYPAEGYVHLAWLLFMVELQWKHAK